MNYSSDIVVVSGESSTGQKTKKMKILVFALVSSEREGKSVIVLDNDSSIEMLNHGAPGVILYL